MSLNQPRAFKGSEEIRFMTNRERPSKLEKKQLRRLANLGLSNFESIDKTQGRQNDFLKLLKGTRVDTTGFEDCDAVSCGQKRCADGCPFGMRRRRLDEIRATHDLMTGIDGPIYDIQVARRCWARPVGKLREMSIGAVIKSIRRALDKLNNPGIVAVGAIKLSRRVQPSDGSSDVWLWQPFIRLVVAGADRHDLERALLTERGGEKLFQVNKVKNLGRTISNALRRDVYASKQPWFDQLSTTKAEKREFYEWSLRWGERIIRYGCDRYFNRLKKHPRPIRPKFPKKRPYPTWLVPHMFGGAKWENNPPHSMTFEPKNKNVRIVDPPPDYYKR
jgi:hypothetical protein